VSRKKTGRGASEATDAELMDRFFADRQGRGASRGDDRKLKQLAREVYRVLSQALAELADPRLESAFALEVRPAPDGSRFALQVSAGTRATVSEVEAALEAARGHLRDELSMALSRKRVPDLVFEVMP
jgi:ribosome-binding factor A